MVSRSRKARRRASKLASLARPKASGGESPAASFFCLISSPMRAKPALRTELLFYLSFLTAAALLLGAATGGRARGRERRVARARAARSDRAGIARLCTTPRRSARSTGPGSRSAQRLRTARSTGGAQTGASEPPRGHWRTAHARQGPCARAGDRQPGPQRRGRGSGRCRDRGGNGVVVRPAPRSPAARYRSAPPCFSSVARVPPLPQGVLRGSDGGAVVRGGFRGRRRA